MPEKIVLHIGSHKTGTTAIQKALLDNREFLRASNITYPDIGFFYFGHHHLVEALRAADGERFAAMAEEINALDGTVVFSSENFCLCPADAVKTLARSLKADSIEIIYYQRNVLELIYLWWLELVKHGNKEILLRFYADSVTRPGRQHLLSPKVILDRWGDAFGRDAVKIFLYENTPDTASHFFKVVLGLSDFESDPGSRYINKSYDTAAVELIRFLNAAGIGGLAAVRENHEGKSLLDHMRKLAAPYLSSISVDFDCMPFKRIEAEFQRHWLARIQNHTGAQHLFSVRSADIRYVDPAFWYSEYEFTQEALRFAESVRAQKNAGAAG
ncbi:MAG: hypothetical protein ABSC92_12205 [Rhizomicrobium sp.]